LIRNGQGGNEWIPLSPGHEQPGQAIPYEVLPFDEMPQVRNPAAGWFVNANNDPAGTTLDNNPLNQLRPGGGILYLNAGYSGFRAGRITQVLKAKLAAGRVSAEDMQALQADVGLIDAQFFVPWILAAWDNATSAGAPPILAAFAGDLQVAEAIARLRAWDFTTPTGIREGYDASDPAETLEEPTAVEVAQSVAATIYSVWRSQFVAGTVDTTLASLGLGSSALRPSGDQSLAALRTLLERFPVLNGFGVSGVNFFDVPGVADPGVRRDVVMLQSLSNALNRLASGDFAAAFNGSTNQDDYRWGKLHRIVFDHPLGEPFSGPPALGAFPAPLAGLRGIPADGGFGVPDASSHDVRANSVNAFMFGHGPARRFVGEGLPTGIRGQLSLPGGPCGVPGSPYYLNLLRRWLANDMFPQLFDPTKLDDNIASIEYFARQY
jgi:penicillin amidase